MGKEFNKTWEFFSNRDKKQNVRYWLNHSEETLIHKINKLVVLKFSDTHFSVINKETLNCKFFDTKEEAIDYCLDVYTNSFFNTQLNLFEE